MKTIIEMAREAEIQTDSAGVWVDDGYITNQLEAFAELVRADERDRVKKALAQPEQEPAAWLTEERYTQLHTAQRPWVGLTDEDMQDVIQRAMHSITGGDNTFTLSANKIWVAIVREVEAKLKEKNA